MAFGADSIDGIDHEVRTRAEELERIFFGVESLVNDGFGVWVDEFDTLGEGAGLWLADGFRSGVNLTIGVGNTEVVEVD